MLIINADDFGRNLLATDRIIACYKNERITSASAMVFMEDSCRAAELAKANNIDVGFHLNFTQEFTGPIQDDVMIRRHKRIGKFLLRNNYFSLLYNPFLTQDFKYSYQKQIEEYLRLYCKPPSHINGHHHMHICMNMLIQKLIPSGQKVRKNFSFFKKQKSLFNRSYRALIDSVLSRRYIMTDYFFSLAQCIAQEQVQRVMELAEKRNVEIETHPETDEEFQWLMGDTYAFASSKMQKISYSQFRA